MHANLNGETHNFVRLYSIESIGLQ